MELLSPRVDFVFKRIFGTEENKDILVSFLNAVFEDSGQPLVDDVEILDPFLHKDALLDKESVLDVKVCLLMWKCSCGIGRILKNALCTTGQNCLRAS